MYQTIMLLKIFFIIKVILKTLKIDSNLLLYLLKVLNYIMMMIND